MLGLMQKRPLLISNLVDYAAACHGEREIVSRDPEGVIHRSNYAEVAARAKRLANALQKLGVGSNERIATLAWNGYRHLEVYYGVTCSGRVLHTVNPRLFHEQLQYIMNHAEDAYVFYDPVFTPLAEQLAPHLRSCAAGWLSASVAQCLQQTSNNLFCYDDLLADASTDCEWPSFDENTACTLCYTSGTTGNPKGVLYSHRSTVLHAFAACSVDGIALECTQFDPRRRASLSRQRLEPALLGGDVRRQACSSRPQARPREHLYASRHKRDARKPVASRRSGSMSWRGSKAIATGSICRV